MAVFGCVTSWLLDLVKFNNATDILKYVQGKLEDKMAAWQAHCVGTECVHAKHLHGIRDWKGWVGELLAAPLSWHSAFMNRQGVDAPHSWCFKARRDLWQTELRNGTEDRWCANSSDIMLCLKAYMSDTRLQQPPLQCLQERQHSPLIREVLPSQLVAHKPLPKTLIDNYLALAQWAEEAGYAEAAQALTELVETRRYERAPLGWLREPREYAQDTSLDRNPFHSHLPRNTWRLVMG
ncbi:unnamed protein product [Effrenium voratum]|nr:unnamed protein product [Effrenium voratum]